MTEENKDFMQELDAENRETMEDYLEKIRREAYRYYEEVIVTDVEGTCPYGHCKGDQFKLTSMNCDGLCGAAYQAIHSQIVTLHHGGAMQWQNDPDSHSGVCPEGVVRLDVKRIAKKELI